MSSVSSSDPKFWGPALWKFLHSMAANYPVDPTPQYRASSRQFFYSLRHLLPCETCRVHYSTLIVKRQPQTESAQSLQEWVLWLHNEVNRRIKPGKLDWTLDQVKSIYKPDKSESTPPAANKPSQSQSQSHPNLDTRPIYSSVPQLSAPEVPLNSVQRILKDSHQEVENPESNLGGSPDNKLPVPNPRSRSLIPRLQSSPSPRQRQAKRQAQRPSHNQPANNPRARKGNHNLLQSGRRQGIPFRSNRVRQPHASQVQHSVSNAKFVRPSSPEASLRTAEVHTSTTISPTRANSGGGGGGDETKKDCGCKK